MPLQYPEIDSRLLRFSFIVNGVVVPCLPGIGGDVKLAGELSEEDFTFYFSDKLSGPLVFSGDDYKLLSGIENSVDRCLSIGLLLEGRPRVGAPWGTMWQGVFSCAEQGSIWNRDRCTFSVSVPTLDKYTALRENWDTQINLLDYPGTGQFKDSYAPRRTVTASLATLAAGIDIEFKRIDKDQEGDYLSSDDKWAVFWRDNSYIYNDRGVGALSGFVISRNLVIFRYRLRRRPLVLSGTTYVVVDMTSSGYYPIGDADTTVTPPVIDYAKTPDLANFRPATLTGFGSNTPFKETGEYVYNAAGNGGLLSTHGSITGNVFLSLPCGDLPSQHGYQNGDYIRITGPEGGYVGGGPGGLGAGGANNAENGGTCLNIREEIDDNRPRSIYFRFGSFRFTRSFPLPDALRFMIERTGAPYIGGVAQHEVPGVLAIMPPTNAYLSDFYTAETNPVTAASGAANEARRLYISAASDIVRFGFTEAADRLMISLRQFLTDVCALHNLRWFVDSATGYLRVESLAYIVNQYGSGPVRDLTAIPDAILPAVYTTRQDQLPRYDDLTIASASTVLGAQVSTGVYETDFGHGVTDYGISSCTNGREGQNRNTTSVTRFTGDVTGMVLNGATVPDNAIAILAVDDNGRLIDANRPLAASRLMQRYHLYERSALSGTVNGLPVTFRSVKPQWEQAGLSMALCYADGLTSTARLTTTLGTGGRLAKREVNLKTLVTTATAWLPIPATDTPAVLPTGRQFDNSFERSFW